jgi:hypothetical protein
MRRRTYRLVQSSSHYLKVLQIVLKKNLYVRPFVGNLQGHFVDL